MVLKKKKMIWFLSSGKTVWFFNPSLNKAAYSLEQKF